MQVLLAHIKETSGRPALSACGHPIRSLCGGCLKIAYCGQDCQTIHWAEDHQYECIGAGIKRDREEESVIDLTQLRDLWGIIKPWLEAQDLKNLRLASPEIERQIRRTYFQHFRVRLTDQSFFAGFRPEIAPFIAKVDDSESGGWLAYFLTQYQRNKTLKDVAIVSNKKIDLNSLTKITHLTTLYLPFNELTNLPDFFGNLVNLTVLHLHDNTLRSLPDSFGNLVNLTTLHLYYNKLKNLPDSFGNLANLTDLILYNNKLKNLPESFGNLNGLTRLLLSNNKLSELPDSFGNLVNLTDLSLNDNQLTYLPESFGNLVNLTELNLSRNLLVNLPESFGNLVNLTELILVLNQLTNLPESFGNLVNLTELLLAGNQLSILPDSFGNLVNLTYLDLVGNQLTDTEEDRMRRLFGNRVTL